VGACVGLWLTPGISFPHARYFMGRLSRSYRVPCPLIPALGMGQWRLADVMGRLSTGTRSYSLLTGTHVISISRCYSSIYCRNEHVLSSVIELNLMPFLEK
jgi:hypothetical protein